MSGQGNDKMSDTGVDRARVTVLVCGRVQGVGYRAFAVGRARTLGLDGQARNLPDGHSVEVVAEGPRARLDQLVAALRRGPIAARVDDVDLTWSAATGNLDSFDVEY